MSSCYDDTGSSSLPALMDSYISFDQAQFHTDEFEQVPCFSIFTQNQTNPIFNNITTNNMEPKLPSPNNNNATTFRGAPYSLDPLSCDRKVLKVVLSQLSKMERNHLNNQILKGSSPSLGEGSSESYLSDVGMPHMWNNY
ncbi:NAC domain containing protein [Trifolium repens]|nr:NAC domain containing protein [Trifolium repens]